MPEDQRVLPDGAPTAIETIRDLIAALTIAVEATETVTARQVKLTKDGIDYFAEVDRFETQMITQALRLSRGSQKKAAQLLGLNATTLNSKIKTLCIDWKTDTDPQSSHWSEITGRERQVSKG